MRQKAIIDSGPLIALFDRNDKFHKQSVRFIKNYKGKLFSTTAVMTEVCYLLDYNVFAQTNFLKWVSNGAIEIVAINNADLLTIIKLTEKYADLPMDFADSTLVAIADRLNISTVATIDSDFNIYRFHKNLSFENIFT